MTYRHCRQLFQSTPSSRKVTNNRCVCRDDRCISIHTFLAEGDIFAPFFRSVKNISIHTFLAEGDFLNIKGKCLYPCSISIHTFLTEGDLQIYYRHSLKSPFQPTPSLRKVTTIVIQCLITGVFQSTPSSRKVTAELIRSGEKYIISIHTFLTEGDIIYCI